MKMTTKKQPRFVRYVLEIPIKKAGEMEDIIQTWGLNVASFEAVSDKTSLLTPTGRKRKVFLSPAQKLAVKTSTDSALILADRFNVSPSVIRRLRPIPRGKAAKAAAERKISGAKK